MNLLKQLAGEDFYDVYMELEQKPISTFANFVKDVKVTQSKLARNNRSKKFND